MVGYNYLTFSPLRFICSGCIVFFLSSCSQQVAQLPCPEVSIPNQASSLTTFVSSTGRDTTDIVFESIIDRVFRTCIYKDSTVNVDTTIIISNTRGPRSEKKLLEFTFFLAVIDKEENILGRETFTVRSTFDKNQQRNEILEEIEQVIPIRVGYRGFDYRILVGFELTPSQLLYNREQRQKGIIKRLP